MLILAVCLLTRYGTPLTNPVDHWAGTRFSDMARGWLALSDITITYGRRDRTGRVESYHCMIRKHQRYGIRALAEYARWGNPESFPCKRPTSYYRDQPPESPYPLCEPTLATEPNEIFEYIIQMTGE